MGSITDFHHSVIQAAGLDPLRDEGIAYAQALAAEG